MPGKHWQIFKTFKPAWVKAQKSFPSGFGWNLLFSSLVLIPAIWFSGLVMAQLSNEELPVPDAITWPVLPGESVNKIAILFYPKDRAMQKRFIAKTLELSHELNPDIAADTVFTQPGTLIIPELKALARTAKPFRTQPRKPDLRMSYRIEDIAKAFITPEMQAAYEKLSLQNEALKRDLQQLHQRLTNIQESLIELKSAAVAFIRNEQLASERLAQVKMPAPIIQKVTAKPLLAREIAFMPPETAPRKHEEKNGTSIDSAWLRLLIEFMLIVAGLILAITSWYWIRQRLFRQIEGVTNDQINAIGRNSSFHDISNSFDLTKSGIFESEQHDTLYIEEFDSVVEEAKILVSMERPAQAISVLLHHIGDHPKDSLHPWLALLDIYRGQDMKEEFVALAKRMHATFNVMTPQWEETKVDMVVAESLEEFPHIISQLEETCATGKGQQYLANLLQDNREGERAGFSLSVLHEIMLLQGMWDRIEEKGEKELADQEV